MCDPVTITTTAMIVAQGLQARQQGRVTEETSEFNARVTENEATRLRNIGVEEENIQREQTAQLLSEQRAQLGAAGVELGAGSALQLQEDTQILGEADALRIRSNVQDQAGALEQQAELTRGFGRAAGEAGRTAFQTSLLAAGAGGVAAKWFSPTSAASQGATSIQTGGSTAPVRGLSFT